MGSELLMNPLDLDDVKFSHRLFPKVVLRLDPFLGEWMSPDYFEKISPPPSTSVMLDQAKAELLRREDYTKFADPSLQASPAVQKNTQPRSGDNESPLETVPDMASALPDSPKTVQTGYNAPTPHYAISNNMKIPDGYVAHARDACLTVDYQWDSSRPPQNWGDGGAYGEEWAAMHKRFRTGAQRLVEWYTNCENPTDMSWKMSSGDTNGATNGQRKEEEEEESVVILVSHGAGCNALIGAITHQPALMDVGVASITLAVRKPMYDDWEKVYGDQKANGSPPVHELYDLKMTANTDHLRGVTPGSPTSGSSLGPLRSRGNTTSSVGQQAVLGPFTYADSYRRASSGSLGKRGSRGPGNPPTAAPTRQGSFGLWSPVKKEEDEGNDFFPDFDNKKFESSVEDEVFGVSKKDDAGLALPDFDTAQAGSGLGSGGSGGLWQGTG